MGLVYGKYGKAGEQHSPCFPFFLVDENAYTVVGTRYHATRYTAHARRGTPTHGGYMWD